MAANKKIKLVTHNGSFHADDVFATAALSIMLEAQGKDFEVIRTRDEEVIKSGDYVYDVGTIYNENKNRFDHHQRSFKAKRKNGIYYSSFGLIWKKFGEKISGSAEAKKVIDEALVEQIDARDNGISIFKPLTTHKSNYDVSSVIGSFTPVWGQANSPEFFNNAVKFAKRILEKEIMQFNAMLMARKLISAAYKKSKNKKLLILDIDIPRYFLNVTVSNYKSLLFIVFKDEKHWKVLAVNKNKGTFDNKKDLPRSWAGLTNEALQKVTGVSDATFCHRKQFMATAKTKEGAIKLAQIALES